VLAKAVSLLMDLNTGLLPYMPGVVALALAGLFLSGWRTDPFPPSAACFAAFFVGALSASTGIEWNTGTSGPSRYAVWLSPFVMLPAAQWGYSPSWHDRTGGGPRHAGRRGWSTPSGMGRRR
jgi:hypothetical protein